jgi:hypothetical protein
MHYLYAGSIWRETLRFLWDIFAENYGLFRAAHLVLLPCIYANALPEIFHAVLVN